MVNSNFQPNPSFIDFAGYGYTPPPSSSSLNQGDQGGKRERTKFNEYQLRQLERVFQNGQYPQGAQREQLAAALTLTETKIQVWFKNRRAKMRANKKFEELRRQTVASLTANHPNPTSSSTTNQQAANASQSTTIKEEQPGGTEDENEGAAKSTKPVRRSEEKAGNHKKCGPAGHFPPAMPMIPLPSAIDYKIDPPVDPSCSAGAGGRASAVADQQHFINSMTSTFNPLTNTATAHPGWMPSAYPSMFGNSANYGLGFANHPSTGTYYHSAAAASMHAYDLYNPAYYAPPGSFASRDSQKFT